MSFETILSNVYNILLIFVNVSEINMVLKNDTKKGTFHLAYVVCLFASS